MLSCDVLAFAMWMKQWNSSLLHPPFASDEILWCNKCRSDFNSCIVSMKRNDEAICLHRYTFVCVCWLFFFMWIDSNEMKCKTQCNAMQYKTHDVLRWNGVDVAALRCHWCWWWYDDATDHGLHWSFTCSSTVSLDCSCAHL